MEMIEDGLIRSAPGEFTASGPTLERIEYLLENYLDGIDVDELSFVSPDAAIELIDHLADQSSEEDTEKNLYSLIFSAISPLVGTVYFDPFALGIEQMTKGSETLAGNAVMSMYKRFSQNITELSVEELQLLGILFNHHRAKLCDPIQYAVITQILKSAYNEGGLDKVWVQGKGLARRKYVHESSGLTQFEYVGHEQLYQEAEKEIADLRLGRRSRMGSPQIEMPDLLSAVETLGRIVERNGLKSTDRLYTASFGIFPFKVQLLKDKFVFRSVLPRGSMRVAVDGKSYKVVIVVLTIERQDSGQSEGKIQFIGEDRAVKMLSWFRNDTDYHRMASL